MEQKAMEEYNKILNKMRDNAQDSYIKTIRDRIASHSQYIENLLRVHEEDNKTINTVMFHYRTVAKHFTLHTLEDVIEMAEQHGAYDLKAKLKGIWQKFRG